MKTRPNTKSLIIMNLITNVPMSIAMSVTGPILNGYPVFTPGFIVNILIGFILACIVNVCLPIPKISAVLPKLFSLSNNTFLGHLIGNILPAFLFVTIIGIVMNYFNVCIIAGQKGVGFLFAFVETFLPMYVVCYLVSLVFVPIAQKIAFGKR